MKSHKDLDVWKNSISLVKEIYIVSKLFPKDELYGLTNQIRRSAVSVASNIAEGAARNYEKEFIRFLFIAKGSLSELETQIIIAKELEYIKEICYNEINEKIIVIRKQRIGLTKYLIRK